MDVLGRGDVRPHGDLRADVGVVGAGEETGGVGDAADAGGESAGYGSERGLVTVFGQI